jgi:hypothetical protein
VVLIVLPVALVRGVMGWLRGGAWTSNDRTLVLLATSVLDIQLLLGLIVYVSGQHWKSENSSTFIAYVHPLVMLGAIAVVHVTSVLIRRTEPANAKFRTLTIGVLVSLVMITAAIPPGTWSHIWA